MLNRATSALAAILACTSLADTAVAATMRTDVATAFGKLVCSGVAIDAHQTWAAGIYDAQIEGRKLEPLDGSRVSEDDALHKARSLAKVRDFGGYASGICANGNGWAAAFPSSAPLSRPDADGRVELPEDALNEKCVSYRADYAARDSGSARELSPDLPLPLDRLAAGTISVTCQPKAPRWQGPVLWFLVPVGDGPSAVPPNVEALAGGTPTSAMIAWINRIRMREGLGALTYSKDLSAQASLLAADGGLSHDRELLRKTANDLNTKKIRLIGEDRVRARDVKQAAWLLWNSPRHRGLILSREATAAGIAVQRRHGEQLFVFVAGENAAVNTSAKSPHQQRALKK